MIWSMIELFMINMAEPRKEVCTHQVLSPHVKFSDAKCYTVEVFVNSVFLICWIKALLTCIKI